MSDRQIANVVRTLTEELTPVASLPPVRTRLQPWAVCCGASLVAATLVFGARRDLPAAMLGPPMLAQLVAMSTVAALAAMAALRLAVPGADQLSLRLWAVGALLAWPGSLLVASQVSGIDIATLVAEPWHPSCGRTILLSALAPAAVIAWMMRGGVVLESRWAAAMAGMSASAVGAIAVAITCPLGNVAHLLIAHAIPTLGIAATLALISMALLRQPSRSRVFAAVALVATLMTATSASAQSTQSEPLPFFTVAASRAGYVSAEPFLEFLRSAGSQPQQAQPSTGQGPLLVGGVILVGGLLLFLGVRMRLPVRVITGVGVCILVGAGYLAYDSYSHQRSQAVTTTASADGWHHSLEEGLAEAKATGKPVFLDVWATWCKNCGVMEATTFKDPKVRSALESYVKVRFQAEDVERPDVSELLDRLDSAGLPTYAVLQPPVR